MSRATTVVSTEPPVVDAASLDSFCCWSLDDENTVVDEATSELAPPRTTTVDVAAVLPAQDEALTLLLSAALNAAARGFGNKMFAARPV